MYLGLHNQTAKYYEKTFSTNHLNKSIFFRMISIAFNRKLFSQYIVKFL